MNKIPLLVAALLLASPALAAPVKCVDAKGKVRYIDESMMAQEKCSAVQDRMQIIQKQPGGATPPPSTNPTAASDFGQSAVAAAEKKLAAAKQALADQEAVRFGNEKNYARVQERLKPYQDAVTKAEQNLDQARRNLR